MGSAPATPDAAAFGGAIRARALPRVRTGRSLAGTAGAGTLAASVRGFGVRLGLSQTNRWALAADDTGARSVRPPIRYWPWDDEPAATPRRPTTGAVAEPPGPVFVPTGNAKLDHLRRILAERKKEGQRMFGAGADSPWAARPAAARAAPEVRIHRGLPRTTARRGSSPVPGRAERGRALPGSIAASLRPQAIDPQRVADVSRTERQPVRRAESLPASRRHRPATEHPGSGAPRSPTLGGVASQARGAVPGVGVRGEVPDSGAPPSRIGEGDSPEAPEPTPHGDHRATPAALEKVPTAPPEPGASPTPVSESTMPGPRAPGPVHGLAHLEPAVMPIAASIPATPHDPPGVDHAWSSSSSTVEHHGPPGSVRPPAPPEPTITPTATPMDQGRSDVKATAISMPPASPTGPNQRENRPAAAGGRADPAASPPLGGAAPASRANVARPLAAAEEHSPPGSVRPPAAPEPSTAAASTTPGTEAGPGPARNEEHAVADQVTADNAGTPPAEPITTEPGTPTTVRPPTVTERPTIPTITTTTTDATRPADVHPAPDDARTLAAEPVTTEPGTPTVRPPTVTERPTTTTTTTTDATRSADVRAAPDHPGTLTPEPITTEPGTLATVPPAVTERSTSPTSTTTSTDATRPADVHPASDPTRTRAAEPIATEPGTPTVRPPAGIEAMTVPTTQRDTNRSHDQPSIEPTPTTVPSAPEDHSRPGSVRPPAVTERTMTPASSALTDAQPVVVSGNTAPTATPASVPDAQPGLDHPSLPSPASDPQHTPGVVRPPALPERTLRPAAPEPPSEPRPAVSPSVAQPASARTAVRPGPAAPADAPPSSPLRLPAEQPSITGAIASVATAPSPSSAADGPGEAQLRRSPAAPAPVAGDLTSTPAAAANVAAALPVRPPAAVGPQQEAGATTPAERFVAAIERAPATPATPLPRHWQRLATAILGDRTRVLVRTDAAAQAALRAAGKVAATRGNVVHLARQPAPTAEGAALMAHEITHVGHPSPEPRFFDDDRPSDEERFAEQVAAMIRRSPVLPRASAGSTAPLAPARSPLPPPAPAIIRRSFDHSLPRRHDEDDQTTISAADLVGRLTGAPSATAAASPTSSDGVIRRQGGRPTIGGHRRQVPAALPDRTPPAPAPSTQLEARSERERWPLLAETVDSSGIQNLVDWIVEQVESRVARDIERRGGRYRGDF